MNAYALTDVGRQRNMNQDYVFSTVKPVGNLPNLFIVADGMGGHKAGDLASKFSVNTFIDCVKNSVSSKQVTRDHSYVEEMVQMGTLNREDARTNEYKNVITRALGGAENVIPDFFEIEIEDNSRILMCTDGLTNMVTDKEIESVMSGHDDIMNKADKLVMMANQNGGKDNISVIIIEP